MLHRDMVLSIKINQNLPSPCMNLVAPQAVNPEAIFNPWWIYREQPFDKPWLIQP